MTKKSRYNKIMALQQQISKENLERQIDREVDVLVEDKSFDGKHILVEHIWMCQKLMELFI